MTTREFALSKGVPSTLSDADAAILDEFNFKLLADDAAKGTESDWDNAFKDALADQANTGHDKASSIPDNIIRDGSHLENGELKPNTTYQTGEHDYIYRTNEDGLITNASTNSLQLKTHYGRLNHNPNTYGKLNGDHAGHLIGDRFGGSPELDNLVSQAKNINQSEYKIIENQWANALKNQQQVAIDITIKYEAGILRPISFDISYTIDSVPFFVSISN